MLGSISLLRSSNLLFNQVNLDTEKKEVKEEPKKSKYTIELGPLFYRSYGSTSVAGINIFRFFDNFGPQKRISGEDAKIKANTDSLNKTINSKIQGYDGYYGHYTPSYDINKLLSDQYKTLFSGDYDAKIFSFFNMNIHILKRIRYSIPSYIFFVIFTNIF